MKYYYDHWYHGYASREESFYLEISAGSYVHILAEEDHLGYASANYTGYIITWEMNFQDANGNWKELDGEEASVKIAQEKIEKILQQAGYRKVDLKLRVME